MDIQKKFKDLGVSDECIATFESLILLNGKDDVHAGIAYAKTLSNLLEDVIKEKGNEFAKNYIEAQAKRIDALFLADPNAHKQALSDMATLLGVKE